MKFEKMLLIGILMNILLLLSMNLAENTLSNNTLNEAFSIIDYEDENSFSNEILKDQDEFNQSGILTNSESNSLSLFETIVKVPKFIKIMWKYSTQAMPNVNLTGVNQDGFTVIEIYTLGIMNLLYIFSWILIFFSVYRLIFK